MSLDGVSKEYLDALELELCDLDLDFVSRMQRAHLARFSFNNIGVLLDEEISLDIEALCEKIVRRNRGGYC
ncbi:MAG: arylamine N-acetyltransferase, partial [Verrucomicrobiia bacterium]